MGPLKHYTNTNKAKFLLEIRMVTNFKIGNYQNFFKKKSKVWGNFSHGGLAAQI